LKALVEEFDGHSVSCIVSHSTDSCQFSRSCIQRWWGRQTARSPMYTVGVEKRYTKS